jgi:hypothetical protein
MFTSIPAIKCAANAVTRDRSSGLGTGMNLTALKHDSRLVVRYFHYVRELSAQFKFLASIADKFRPSRSVECEFDLGQITVMRASAPKGGLRCVCDGKNVFEVLVISRFWRDCEVVVHVHPFLLSNAYTTFSRLVGQSKSALRVKARRCIAAFTSALSGLYRLDTYINSSTSSFIFLFISWNVACRFAVICLFKLRCNICDAIFATKVGIVRATLHQASKVETCVTESSTFTEKGSPLSRDTQALSARSARLALRRVNSTERMSSQLHHSLPSGILDSGKLT